jgi:hypothetical protein
MTTDYNSLPEYKISWEECDKITVHTLKFYKNLADESKEVHVDDVEYNEKLKESIDFILKYLGEENDN